jgi:exopolysaccharide biosynthesis polyprenyl glycosylphosphotransferase
MLRQSRQTRTRVHQICDGAFFALSMVIAYVLREGLSWIDALGLSPLEPFSEFVWVPLFVAVSGPVFLKAQGFYSNFNSNPDSARRPQAGAAARATVFTALTVVIVLFLARVQVARSVVIFGCALGGVFAYVRAIFAERLASSRLAREQWRERVLWVGNPEANRRHRAALLSAEVAHVADIGDFDPAQQPPERLAEVLHEHAINTVIFERDGMGALAPYMECCAREGVSVVIRTGVRLSVAPFASAAHLDSLGGETVIHYRAAHRAGPGALVVKRAMDVVLSAMALAVLPPVFALVALVIKLTSRGPVFFTQTRAGLNGRPFEMVKFRTMRAGAEGEQGALAVRNEMRGPVFKMENDPRITPPGRFLRRHAIDELPQLWNVLRGEMSLVGPRPLPVYEVEKFSNDAHRRRQSMRPGLTCLWQISGRNEIADFAEWVRLDLAYIDRWSLWLDVRIMLATAPVVIFGRGGR